MGWLSNKINEWADEYEAEKEAKAKEEYKPFQHRRPEYSFNEDEKLENTAPHLVASVYEARNNTREIKDDVHALMEQLSSKYDELEKHYTKLETMLQELNEQKASLTKSSKAR